MVEFTQKKCPTCGGSLERISGRRYECRCCHNVYDLERHNESLDNALQVAATFKDSLNFKQAEMLYRNLLVQFRDEDLSDVYWNLFLCEQRVLFETDQNGERFPSFYDVVSDRIQNSQNYAKALEYAGKYDPAKYRNYVNLADRIAEAKNKFRLIRQTTRPYDVFICFKKSADDGSLTSDYKLAYELYNKLGRDFNVFFSERSLDSIVVREYEPNIYHALYTAKVMLVLCSKKDYLQSQWVRNEWSRFSAMTKTTVQPKSIIPVFIDGFVPEDLPDELRSCQGFVADISLTENLTKAINAILKPVDREAEIAASVEAQLNKRAPISSAPTSRPQGNRKRITKKQGAVIAVVSCIVVVFICVMLGVYLPGAINNVPDIIDFSSPCGGDCSIMKRYSENLVYNSAISQYETHKAIDIRGYDNIYVYAIYDGTVLDMGKNETNGSYLIIDHGNGYVAKYMSLMTDSSTVFNTHLEIGSTVQRGQIIGLMGDTMMFEEGVHLHLELLKDNESIDPSTVIEDLKKLS